MAIQNPGNITYAEIHVANYAMCHVLYLKGWKLVNRRCKTTFPHMLFYIRGLTN